MKELEFDDFGEIVIGSELKQIGLKEEIKKYLQELGRDFFDYGSGFYVDVASNVGRLVSSGKYEKGILICRTGIGMDIVANKIPGIRAARCLDAVSARESRRVNDSNILALADVNLELARDIVYNWLTSEFSGEAKYIEGIKKIKALEYESARG